MKFVLFTLSRLPFSVLHRISDALYYLIYYGLGYRRKVVRENLVNSFPEKSLDEIVAIEKKFYRNFSDIMVEALKNFTITKEEVLERCKYTTKEVTDALFASGTNLSGFCSHLASWEYLPLVLGYELDYLTYCIYKPLSNKKLDDLVLESREKAGMKLVPIKKLRSVLADPVKRPHVWGLLSDQAPHDFSKAFEVQFLNQKTYVVPGAAVLAVQKDLPVVWAWMARTGRTRFECGFELMTVDESKTDWTESELAQIKRISGAHGLTEAQSKKALLLVQEYSKRLEERIKMAPQDWLWSHRRWKKR